MLNFFRESYVLRLHTDTRTRSSFPSLLIVSPVILAQHTHTHTHIHTQWHCAFERSRLTKTIYEHRGSTPPPSTLNHALSCPHSHPASAPGLFSLLFIVFFFSKFFSSFFISTRSPVLVLSFSSFPLQLSHCQFPLTIVFI